MYESYPVATAKIALKTVVVHNREENIAASAFSLISCAILPTVASNPNPLERMNNPNTNGKAPITTPPNASGSMMPRPNIAIIAPSGTSIFALHFGSSSAFTM